MKIAYFDCFAGVSGDMILGALLDAGLKLEELKRALNRVPVKGYRIAARRVMRGGLAGTKAGVHLESGAGKGVRGLDDIRAILRRSRLAPDIIATADRIFTELARAEARVHRTRLARAHFHEVGAIDAIVDVVGSIAGLKALGVDEVYASALPWNSGTVECAHGMLPVPAPATAELMKGMPVYRHSVNGEMVTPTGAAILKIRAKRIGQMPALRVSRIGYGAGGEQFGNFPNLLRLVIGEGGGACGTETVGIVETEIDDMSPAIYDYLSGRLYGAGAYDVYVTPIMMKKNRPGQLLTVLCSPEQIPFMADIIFTESTTLGVRFRESERLILKREVISVRTPHGRVRVKLAKRPDGRVNASPEYDDCARLAAEKGVSLRRVIAAASQAAEVETKTTRFSRDATADKAD
ncbi:MAG: nickel pincer cofactor biosynthesis protein LarC [bacterium]